MGYRPTAYMPRKRMNKPIVELDKPKGKIKAYWESAKAAGAHYGINVVNISYNCTGQTHQAKGHYFRFATPAEIEQYKKLDNLLEEVENVVEQTITDEKIDIPNGPAPTLPEIIEPDEIQKDTLSPFARLLEESKKKFKDNSI